MSFAENLKQIRKEKQMSQEDLAEMLDVSRQAVSKWEQGNGYPEVEKLLLLSGRLDISLDSLMSSEIAELSDNDSSHRSDIKSDQAKTDIKGTIIITSPHENVITTCYKVISSGKMGGSKTAPKYALFGVSPGTSSFWGEPTTFLGWYADKEQISKEILEIQHAITGGLSTYTLKYSAKTERKWAKIKIIEE